MSRYYKRWNDFEVTKREIIASVPIVIVMLLIGVLITGKISEYQMDKNEKYNKAIQVTTKDLFQYGIDTSVGNAFVYGDLKAVDTVTYPEIGGEYMYVEKVKERYTEHTRTVKDSKGKSHTETYWTWDYVGTENIQSQNVTFCNINFESNKFNIPDGYYIETVKESYYIRYKYYGYPIETTGTIFAYLNKDNNLGDSKVRFYKDKDIDQTLDFLEYNYETIIFWIAWILIISLCVYGFYYLDNNWLNN